MTTDLGLPPFTLPDGAPFWSPHLRDEAWFRAVWCLLRDALLAADGDREKARALLPGLAREFSASLGEPDPEYAIVVADRAWRLAYGAPDPAPRS